ncbi:hypothetical protein CK203_046183 [Vitis vinifera]|uniref:Uncharacterized protein n=1 Tax=Vitis vinifera TaxID=29760 RepID=A0A438I4B8_VITVI|nr:hypothetical protein CK203_046183 [Vitis vinifera]
MGEVESLFRKLQPLAVRRDAEDFLSWRESRNGCFSVVPFIVPSRGLLVIPSHGALFGGGDGIFQIDATCVKRKRKPVTISFWGTCLGCTEALWVKEGRRREGLHLYA